MFKNKWLLALIVVALAASAVWGQGGPRGAISGVVKDESGAVVPGATIKITNSDTGVVERQVVSGSDGTYFANLLPIGTYTLEVAAKGFSRAEAPGIRVRVTETTTVPITLKVGAVEQSITVSDAASPLMYSSPATGQSITKVGDLPLPTRNLLQLLALSPGTSTDLSDTAALGRGSVSIEVNGQRPTNNNYQVEGVNANDYNLPQFDYVPVPNGSAVAEFKTQTSLYDASQGRNAGGNINVVMKSGTSKFHGDAFEFFRNEKLNANDWFLNQQGKPRPVLKQNQFGGSFGGPIPKTGAFFFLNYQGTRQRSGLASGTQLNSLIIALPEDRSAANLSRLFGVPAGQIHPVALRLLNLKGTHFGSSTFLIPSLPAEVAGVHPRGRLVQSRPGKYQDDQFVVSADKQVGEKDRFSVRWFFSDNEAVRPFGGAGSLPQPRLSPGSNRLLTVSETHSFGPTAVNEFRFGFNRFFFANAPTEFIKLSDIGATRPNASDFPAAFQFSVAAPGFSIGTGVNDDRGGAFNTFTWSDAFSKTWGKHSIRFGAQFDRYQLNRYNRFATRGSVSFTARGGNTAFQNFLLGNITSTQGGSGFYTFYFRTTDFAAFVQDDWKLTPRLTVNLGLRWEPFAISHEKFNLLANLSGINDDDPVRFVFPEDLKLRDLGTRGVPNCTFKNCRDWRNLAPRFGFAWDPTGSQRWAIRGGYGVYFQRISNQTLLQSTGGDVFNQAVSDTGVPLDNPFQRLRPQSDFPLNPTPIPRLVSVAAGGLGAPTFTGPSPGFSFFGDRNLRTPYTQQWNLTVQRQIGRGWVAETGYVGTKGTALLFGQALNQALPATASSPLTQPTTTGSVTITGSTLDNIDARVPTKFLGIFVGRLLPVTNDGASIYHSWQGSLTRRWAENYFQAAYTWSKALDNTSGSLSVDELNGNLLWNGNQRLSRGLADFDRTHRLVLSYSYELPFFRSATGLKRHLLGGWGTNGVFTFQTGNPFTVYDSGGGSLLGVDICCLATANVAPGRTYESAKKSGPIQNRLDEYFDTKAFTTVPCVDAQLRPVPSCNDARAEGTLIGNAGRNILRGPFQQNWDFSIFKRFRITESHALEFRTEFFNLWNQPVFASPGCGVGPCGLPSVDIQSGAGAGAIESTANRPRVIQLVLRYTF